MSFEEFVALFSAADEEIKELIIRLLGGEDPQ